MCGVFGYISEAGGKPNIKRLQGIAKVTQSRGRHAFGFAWLDDAGRLRAFKSTGAIGDSLHLLAMMRDARIIIGHCRYATQGDPDNNLNNHPHFCDGGWIVHNGMIPNYQRIIDKRDLHPVTDCDSETIGLLLETMPGPLLQRSAAMMEKIGRDAVVLGLWSKPGRLMVARNGNPLYVGSTKSGMYFGSCQGSLPDNRKALRDGTVVVYSHDREGVIDARDIELPKIEAPPLWQRCQAACEEEAPAAKTDERKPIWQILDEAKF